MAQVINTNIASLNAQRNLNRSQGALATSLQRLSSGMRINSAKDDAAGLAISERFTAQIRGLNQAVRNSNDGISLSQTAEGAMGEVTNNLQRIRELAIQSANATNSASDRAAMQEEVTALLDEIDRVATQTSFNGISLLDGSFSEQAFQVGANVGETISVSSIADATSEGLGLNLGVATGTYTVDSADFAAGGLSVNGEAIDAPADIDELAAAISASSPYVSATVGGYEASLGALAASTLGDGTNGNIVISIDGQEYTATITGDADDQPDATEIAAAISTALGDDFTATNDGGNLLITRTDGAAFTVDSLTAAAGAGIASVATSTAAAGTTLELKSYGRDLELTGTGVAMLGLTEDTVAAAQENTAGVTTVEGANAMIAAVDGALDTVNSSRASLGAVQNRFESVINSLQTAVESMSAARSRIQDADFAAETAQMTKSQILQQAGTTVLAQANTLPQNVLSLLG